MPKINQCFNPNHGWTNYPLLCFLWPWLLNESLFTPLNHPAFAHVFLDLSYSVRYKSYFFKCSGSPELNLLSNFSMIHLSVWWCQYEPTLSSFHALMVFKPVMKLTSRDTEFVRAPITFNSLLSNYFLSSFKGYLGPLTLCPSIKISSHRLWYCSYLSKSLRNPCDLQHINLSNLPHFASLLLSLLK